ncbi:carbohydrate ABC transporter permease [Pseudarthrobacter sp. YS3]|jgi:multiple sugar transport system permease protein|uniref:carbohydrate ABC transporter permease n=1 Tax=Pseudarthrobacter sp. YS3 TaxID=3453718 RepID=UPI003EEA2C98
MSDTTTAPERETLLGRTEVPAAQRSKRRPGRQSAEVNRLLPKPLLVTVIAGLCTVIAIPLLYVVFASMNSDVEVARGAYFPTEFTLGNYAKIWKTLPLGLGLTNSILTAGAVAVVASLLGIITAYVLVRFEFRGRLGILRGLIGLQSLPGTLLLLPVFVVFASAGNYLGITVIGTSWGLFLAYLTFALPFAIWVMVTYLRGLPKELEEAARIDGASSVGVLFRIIFPLSWPGLVVSGVFSFLLGWNDVLFASVLTRPNTQTVAVVLQVFGSSSEGGALPLYGQMMAASLVCAAPVVILYLIFQRFLVGGLTAGSVK